MIQTVKMSEQARQEYRFKSAVIMDAEDRGSRQAKFETAKTMLAMGYPLGDICKISGLSQDEVQSVGNV